MHNTGTAPLTIGNPETLPEIIRSKQSALAGARTSAEVLEARDMAAAAYDAASRFTRRKAAFDRMTALAMRMQAQALRIEASAATKSTRPGVRAMPGAPTPKGQP